MYVDVMKIHDTIYYLYERVFALKILYIYILCNINNYHKTKYSACARAHSAQTEYSEK